MKKKTTKTTKVTKTTKRKRGVPKPRRIEPVRVISEEDKKALEIIRETIVSQKEVTGTPMTRDQIELIKSQYAKGATDDELRLFLAVCSRTGLDPFRKQIYFIKRWDNKQGREVGSAQTSIDGLRSIAEKTNKYAGNDDPQFDDENNPKKATVTVYKIVEGIRVPFTATARWDQYVPKDKKGEIIGPFWKKMPHLMLGKCAEALALRKAFPSAMAGIYITEEIGKEEDKKMLDTDKAYLKLKAQIEKMNEEQLKKYNEMMQKSDKYSDEQKQEFQGLIDARIKEISEIKEC